MNPCDPITSLKASYEAHMALLEEYKKLYKTTVPHCHADCFLEIELRTNPAIVATKEAMSATWRCIQSHKKD